MTALFPSSGAGAELPPAKPVADVIASAPDAWVEFFEELTAGGIQLKLFGRLEGRGTGESS